MEQKTQFEDYTVEVRNRLKGLDLIDRVPDELWNEVHDIVQKTGIKTIPMELQEGGGANSTKQLLNAGRGHQAPRKATQLFEKEKI